MTDSLLAFEDLPQSLQDKIRPPRKLTLADRIRHAEMTASIFPRKYARRAEAMSDDARRSEERERGCPPLLTGGESLGTQPLATNCRVGKPKKNCSLLPLVSVACFR
ncbi:hypothetical protein [Methylomonas koyamae]|uniref:hypothetical protein n=1 Tax=Methylomonas koyamae TaxID=702114 RepID=UPI000A3EFF3E|nr:hypothetical protein [Methylomonas koyamae]